MPRWMKKFCIGIAVVALLLAGFYRFWMYPRYTVPILTYHYIDGNPWTLSVSPEIFERQMKYLKDRNYNVISLDELVDGLRKGRDLPRNTVVITFDDGWEVLYDNAFPVLKKCKFPVTIFVITQWTDGKTFLNWNQIREMAQYGIDFGSHMQKHSYIPDLKREQIVAEVAGSKDDLERELGKPARHFCYPSGGFTEEAKEIVREAGYLSASTTNRGTDRYNNDLYELMRVKVTNSDAVKPFHFWAKLSGYYNLFRGVKAGD